MKFLYKLTRNGGATYICVPLSILEHKRWRPGDPMIVEINGEGHFQVREPTPNDLRTASRPMCLDRKLPETA